MNIEEQDFTDRGSASYDECLDEAKAVTAALLACSAGELSWQESVLDETYWAIVRDLRPSEQRRLEQSQERWLARREHICAAYFKDGAGTLELVGYSFCLPGETERRVKWLDDRYLSEHEPTTVYAEHSPGWISDANSSVESYGLYQFSARAGTLSRFLASPEFRPWAKRFKGLTPETEEFDAQWRVSENQAPDTFSDAQRAFVFRTRYEPVVAEVARLTGYDINHASRALREVTYSVAVQHGRAVQILREAVRQTDGTLKRADAGYQHALIRRIYLLRACDVRRMMDRARAEKRTGDIKALGTIVTARYPDEQENALELLAG